MNKLIRSIYLILALSLSFNSKATENNPVILASIQPITLLVQSVLGDFAKAESIIGTDELSMHSYRLKYSDISTIKKAQDIFIIHPNLEKSIHKVALETASLRVHTLFQTEANDYHHSDEEHSDHHSDEDHSNHHSDEEHSDHHSDHHSDEDHSNHHSDHHSDEDHSNHHSDEEHSDHHSDEYHSNHHSDEEHSNHHSDHHSDEEHSDHHSDHDNHNHGSVDYHIWLDPAIAIQMLDLIQEKLTISYPNYAKVFYENAKKEKEKIKQTDIEIAKIFENTKSSPFLIFHDALGYFSSRYGLNVVDFIVDENGNFSAAKLNELRNLIDKNDIHCVFVEEDFLSAEKVVKTLAQNREISIEKIQLLGNKDGSEKSYSDFLNNFAHSINSCLVNHS